MAVLVLLCISKSVSDTFPTSRNVYLWPFANHSVCLLFSHHTCPLFALTPCLLTLFIPLPTVDLFSSPSTSYTYIQTATPLPLLFLLLTLLQIWNIPIGKNAKYVDVNLNLERFGSVREQKKEEQSINIYM